ncbi:MAG: aminotransferase class I/II-fold pyridoxal phosphate-dependent enzyme [Gemmatimonadota bacterium]
MAELRGVSRRGFLGGMAGALGGLGLAPDIALAGLAPARQAELLRQRAADPYDRMAKLANNENPWGPSPAMLDAMTDAFKYANRYGYPDAQIQKAIADHHDVDPDHILLAAGSGEILDVVGSTFLDGGLLVVGSEPSYGSVYRHATSIKSDAVLVPLLSDHRQDIPALIDATVRNHRRVGFVYLCNPNNPTGRIVPDREVRQLLDAIPDDVPVLIDEAYHHFIEDPAYATVLPYVLEGRNVVIARTFSKIYGMAGMRLGYAIAAPDVLQRMRPYSTGSINALVKWGGAAALADTEAEARVRRETIRLRKEAVADLESLGFDVIPSETNFFMVDVRRPVGPVIAAFREREVLVGRPFPPMLEHLRVSVGLPEEMDRFAHAFREIFEVTATSGRS